MKKNGEEVEENGEMGVSEAISVVEEKTPPEIIIPEAWAQASNSITFDSKLPPIAFICGPSNSGKTTFSRILLNNLLQRYKEVAYLDTDVGQPEFTPPGCLSLCIVDKQTSDLTVACLKTPERCFYYGDVSSKNDPQTYVDNICSLYDHFRKEHMSDGREDRGKPQLPLVINTPGWVKGAGYEMLVKILRYIGPTHVVQIRISMEVKNLPAGPFWLDANEETSVNLIELGTARQDALKRSVLVQKDAANIRELRIIAYFRQCFPIDADIATFKELAQSLASHPPYVVPISKIKVQHLHSQVPSSEMFYSLNASIVGLAVSAAKSSDSEQSTPWCVGLGIVRGIDVPKGVFYVLTPVPRKKLEKVDLFLQGMLQIPRRLMEAPYCRSPYLAPNVMGTSDVEMVGR